MNALIIIINKLIMSITRRWLSCQGIAKGLVFQGPQSSPKSNQGHLKIYGNHFSISLINKGIYIYQIRWTIYIYQNSTTIFVKVVLSM
jgi:hypothetical protein